MLTRIPFLPRPYRAGFLGIRYEDKQPERTEKAGDLKRWITVKDKYGEIITTAFSRAEDNQFSRNELANKGYDRLREHIFFLADKTAYNLNAYKRMVSDEALAMATIRVLKLDEIAGLDAEKLDPANVLPYLKNATQFQIGDILRLTIQRGLEKAERGDPYLAKEDFPKTGEPVLKPEGPKTPPPAENLETMRAEINDLKAEINDLRQELDGMKSTMATKNDLRTMEERLANLFKGGGQPPAPGAPPVAPGRGRPGTGPGPGTGSTQEVGEPSVTPEPGGPGTGQGPGTDGEGRAVSNATTEGKEPEAGIPASAEELDKLRKEEFNNAEMGTTTPLTEEKIASAIPLETATIKTLEATTPASTGSGDEAQTEEMNLEELQGYEDKILRDSGLSAKDQKALGTQAAKMTEDQLSKMDPLESARIKMSPGRLTLMNIGNMKKILEERNKTPASPVVLPPVVPAVETSGPGGAGTVPTGSGDGAQTIKTTVPAESTSAGSAPAGVNEEDKSMGGFDMSLRTEPRPELGGKSYDEFRQELEGKTYEDLIQKPINEMNYEEAKRARDLLLEKFPEGERDKAVSDAEKRAEDKFRDFYTKSGKKFWMDKSKNIRDYWAEETSSPKEWMEARLNALQEVYGRWKEGKPIVQTPATTEETPSAELTPEDREQQELDKAIDAIRELTLSEPDAEKVQAGIFGEATRRVEKEIDGLPEAERAEYIREENRLNHSRLYVDKLQEAFSEYQANPVKFFESIEDTITKPAVDRVTDQAEQQATTQLSEEGVKTAEETEWLRHFREEPRGTRGMEKRDAEIGKFRSNLQALNYTFERTTQSRTGLPMIRIHNEKGGPVFLLKDGTERGFLELNETNKFLEKRIKEEKKKPAIVAQTPAPTETQQPTSEETAPELEVELTEVQKAEIAFKEASKASSDKYFERIHALGEYEPYDIVFKAWNPGYRNYKKAFEESGLETEEAFDATKSGKKFPTKEERDNLWENVQKAEEAFDATELGKKLLEEWNRLWDVREKAEEALKQAKAKAAASSPAPASIPTPATPPSITESVGGGKKEELSLEEQLLAMLRGLPSEEGKSGTTPPAGTEQKPLSPEEQRLKELGDKGLFDKPPTESNQGNNTPNKP